MNEKMNNETVALPDENAEDIRDTLDGQDAQDITEEPTSALDEEYTLAESDDEPEDGEYDEEDFNEKFPETVGVEITDKEKYSALRALGLTHSEAYSFAERRAVRLDGRAHLTSGVPTAAKSPSVGMSRRELREAREIFSGLSDADIFKLYKKVTKQERI